MAISVSSYVDQWVLACHQCGYCVFGSTCLLKTWAALGASPSSQEISQEGYTLTFRKWPAWQGLQAGEVAQYPEYFRLGNIWNHINLSPTRGVDNFKVAYSLTPFYQQGSTGVFHVQGLPYQFNHSPMVCSQYNGSLLSLVAKED